MRARDRRALSPAAVPPPPRPHPATPSPRTPVTPRAGHLPIITSPEENYELHSLFDPIAAGGGGEAAAEAACPGYLGSDVRAHGVAWTKIATKKECSPYLGVQLGVFDTVRECAHACAKKAGCKYFIYRNAEYVGPHSFGKCFEEKSAGLREVYTSGKASGYECVEGWANTRAADKHWDYYALSVGMGDAPPAATCTAWDFSADACKAAKDEMAASTGGFYASEFGGLGCYLYTGESVGFPEEGKGKGTTYFGFGAGTETNPVNPDGTYMSLPEHLPDLGPPEEGRTAVPGYPRCAEYDYAKVPGFYAQYPYYLAPTGVQTCPSGTSPNTVSDCEAAAAGMLAELGLTAGRSIQSASNPGCGTGQGWGAVPTGCSVQLGGDNTAHLHTRVGRTVRFPRPPTRWCALTTIGRLPARRRSRSRRSRSCRIRTRIRFRRSRRTHCAARATSSASTSPWRRMWSATQRRRALPSSRTRALACSHREVVIEREPAVWHDIANESITYGEGYGAPGSEGEGEADEGLYMLGEPGSALCATRESHPYILGPPGTAECADDDHEPVSMAECNVAVALLSTASRTAALRGSKRSIGPWMNKGGWIPALHNDNLRRHLVGASARRLLGSVWRRLGRATASASAPTATTGTCRCTRTTTLHRRGVPTGVQEEGRGHRRRPRAPPGVRARGRGRVPGGRRSAVPRHAALRRPRGDQRLRSRRVREPAKKIRRQVHGRQRLLGGVGRAEARRRHRVARCAAGLLSAGGNFGTRWNAYWRTGGTRKPASSDCYSLLYYPVCKRKGVVKAPGYRQSYRPTHSPTSDRRPRSGATAGSPSRRTGRAIASRRTRRTTWDDGRDIGVGVHQVCHLRRVARRVLAALRRLRPRLLHLGPALPSHGKIPWDEGEDTFGESSSETYSGWILNNDDNDDYEGSAYWQRDPFGGWDSNGDSNSGSLFQSPQPCFCKDETQAKVPGTRKVGATSGRACKSTTPYSEEELAYKAQTCEAGIEADVFQYPGNQVARSVLLQAGTGDPRLCAQHCARQADDCAGASDCAGTLKATHFNMWRGASMSLEQQGGKAKGQWKTHNPYADHKNGENGEFNWWHCACTTSDPAIWATKGDDGVDDPVQRDPQRKLRLPSQQGRGAWSPWAGRR